MEHDPDTRRTLRQRKGFLTFQTSKMEEYLWIGSSERDESLRDQPTCYAFKKGAVKRRCLRCWHLECAFHRNGSCKLASRCAFTHYEKSVDGSKKRKDSVTVANMVDASVRSEAMQGKTFCVVLRAFPSKQNCV